jgi:hypothetical protein
MSGCRTPESPPKVLASTEFEVIADTLRILGPLPTATDLPLHAPALRLLGSLQHPVDAAELGEGRIAVLDRLAEQVVLFTADGSELGTIGRPGDGPGELSDPYAIAAISDGFVVWEQDGTLSRFRRDGTLAASRREPVAGDWDAIHNRYPISGWDHPFQMPREIVQHRLGAWDESSFALELREDERDPELTDAERARLLASPMASLIRFDTTLAVVDTIARRASAPLVARAPIPGAYQTYATPVYAPRPLWAASSRWYALAPGAEALVRVVRLGGRALIVKWRHAPRAIGTREKQAALDWEYEAALLTAEEPFREAAEQMGRRERERMDGILRERYPWSQFGPALKAMIASGPCLALFGFSPEASYLGISNVALVVRVRGAPAVGVLVLPEGAVPLTGSRHGLWISARDTLGVLSLARYALPDDVCGER